MKLHESSLRGDFGAIQAGGRMKIIVGDAGFVSEPGTVVAHRLLRRGASSLCWATDGIPVSSPHRTPGRCRLRNFGTPDD